MAYPDRSAPWHSLADAPNLERYDAIAPTRLRQAPLYLEYLASIDECHSTLMFTAPATGYGVTYAELMYEVGGRTFALTTQLQIVPSAAAKAAKTAGK